MSKIISLNDFKNKQENNEGEEKLTKINGIYATASSAINILSPAMAGVLLNVMDFGHTLFIDCITALLAIIVLLKLKYKNTISSNKDTSTLSDFLEGVKYFKQHIFLGRLILFYLLFYFFMSAPAFLISHHAPPPHGAQALSSP